MKLGGSEEDVNASFPARRLDGVSGGIDVLGHAARKAADDRAFDLAGDFLDRGEVAFAGDGKTRFDDVDAKPGKLARDFELFTRGHGRARTLLAITERG